MSKVPVNTTQAPAPRQGAGIRLYNQAIIANGLVFCSGQLPKDPETGKIISGTIEDRTHQCIANLKAVLEAAGSSLEKAVEVNVFLADLEDFPRMNSVYAQYWGDVKPAGTCVAVRSLAEHTDIEIKCIALA